MSDQVLIAIISGVFAVLLALVGNQARQAKNFAEPTGNGFARKVIEHLENQTETLDDTAEQLTEVRKELLELYKRDAIDHAHNRKTDEFIRAAEARLAALERKQP